MRIASLALAICILAPLASAMVEEAPPPQRLHAEALDGINVQVSWTASQDADPVGYRVIAQGREIAYTTTTSVLAKWAPEYLVTAVYQDAEGLRESEPASVMGPVPLVGGYLFGDDAPVRLMLNLGPDDDEYNPLYRAACIPNRAATDWDDPPFLFVGFTSSCQQGLWWTIGVNGWVIANEAVGIVYGVF